ncbi:hypothetical protein Pint_26417 [Pistacia integerrima]|uniref:Uncharacterized protein n=1 Tax=Pistacia integerrima TaxID=434235 RepID=A0ACC0YG42_9ROSI|nr:hypothetical protein Pint_26417 [Pistacia integerrima]
MDSKLLFHLQLTGLISNSLKLDIRVCYLFSTIHVDDGPFMDPEERLEWRRKIREVIDRCPDVKEEIEPLERKKKMKKPQQITHLLWRRMILVGPKMLADRWGFNLGQFSDEITIKNVKNDPANCLTAAVSTTENGRSSQKLAGFQLQSLKLSETSQ